MLTGDEHVRHGRTTNTLAQCLADLHAPAVLLVLDGVDVDTLVLHAERVE